MTETAVDVLAGEMNRLRGHMLGMVEAVGLPDRQERGLKQLIKSMTYEGQRSIAEALETSPVPYGECHCGCGEETTPYRSTRSAKGQIKGEPQKFVKNHRLTSVGYEIDETTGCWEWTLAKDDDGYGRMGTALAHRYIYSVCRGPIEEGLHLHHKCFNTGCVNPLHLEPVTSEVHTELTRMRYRDELMEEVRDLAHGALTALERGDIGTAVDTLKYLTYDAEKTIREAIEAISAPGSEE